MIIDNFMLTMHQACPAKYALRKAGWTRKVKSGALGFGGAVHAGLATWYKTGSLDAAVASIESEWDIMVNPDDHRTLDRAIYMMKEYVKYYPTETFRTVQGSDGPLIEVAFTLDTGLTLKDGEPIEYGGIFDGLVEAGGNVYILEHKTTSQLGSMYFYQFKPNNQVTGYVWAAGQLSGQRVGGAIINALCLTRGGKVSFDRSLTTRSDEDISRWLHDLQVECQNIRDNEIAGHFPMRTPSCTHYGLCEYHQVHTLSGEKEQNMILQEHYVQEEWDHESRDEEAGAK